MGDIAFLDTATIRTGWACGGGDSLPSVGCWTLPGSKNGVYGPLALALHHSLSTLFATRDIEILGYEKPIKTPIDSLDKLRKLYGMGFYIEGFVARWNEVHPDRPVRCVDVDLRDIKRELAGFSSAEKKDMVAAAQKVGLTLPPGEAAKDAADAFGGWLVLIRLYRRQFLPKWDQALYGGRGALPF